MYNQFVVENTAIDESNLLTAEGKAHGIDAKIDAAMKAVDTWSVKIENIGQQITQLQHSLAKKADGDLPPPRGLRIQLMVQKLSQLDPLEVEAAYYASDLVDQKAIEIASAQVGRLPLKQGRARALATAAQSPTSSRRSSPPAPCSRIRRWRRSWKI